MPHARLWLFALILLAIALVLLAWRCRRRRVPRVSLRPIGLAACIGAAAAPFRSTTRSYRLIGAEVATPERLAVPCSVH